MINYFQGSQVRVMATFENNLHALADPSVITARLKTPAGVTTVYIYQTNVELVRASLGIYYVDLLVNAAGVWSYRFEGTGTVTAASQDQLLCIGANPA